MVLIRVRVSNPQQLTLTQILVECPPSHSRRGGCMNGPPCVTLLSSPIKSQKNICIGGYNHSGNFSHHYCKLPFFCHMLLIQIHFLESSPFFKIFPISFCCKLWQSYWLGIPRIFSYPPDFYAPDLLVFVFISFLFCFWIIHSYSKNTWTLSPVSALFLTSKEESDWSL